MIATRSDTARPTVYRPTSLPEHRTVVEQRADGCPAFCGTGRDIAAALRRFVSAMPQVPGEASAGPISCSKPSRSQGPFWNFAWGRNGR